MNYISSQRHEGWIALPDRYDDGGFSGGNMERPAIKRLFADIEQGLIDVVDKKLKVNIVEAETIRFIYEEYYRTLSPLKVVKALRRAEGLSTKTRVYENGKTVGGKKICTKLVYDTLNNPIYIGKVRHKKEIYNGEHKAIKQGRDSCDIKTFPADETPNFVLAKIREMIVSPELLKRGRTGKQNSKMAQ